ncbi:MAG: GDYXXLXY domain-containing protein [Polyangiales bacterium]
MTKDQSRFTRATLIAVSVQLAIIAVIPMQPLWVRATGTTVYLETEKTDPRSLFRGYYAILGYRVAQEIASPEMVQASKATGKPVYVTVTTDRPGRFVGISLERPELRDGEACIVGRVRGWGAIGATPTGERSEPALQSVDFPQIAQYFASSEEAHRIEGARSDELLAKVATSSRCDAQLVGLEAGK